MNDAETYGRRLIAFPQLRERVDLERAEGRREQFADLDAVIEDLLRRALAGERVLRLGDRHDDETVELLGLDGPTEQRIAETCDVAAMESRGAWALPERETLIAGAINFGWWVRQEPRLVSSLAGDERRKITLRNNPTGVFAWAALAPLFELLVIPHELRSALAGKADVDAQAKQWAKLDALLTATGLDLDEELAAFRPRSGWSRLRAQDRADARVRLVEAWARNATADMAAMLRMWMISGLVDRFYAKAKKTPPTSRQVLTKAFWRPMAACFGGDWLAFLRYLGEEPAANEEIITSLPEAKLYVGGDERAREAAAAAGVDAAEVERMLSSFFGGGDPTSPVERRVEVLKRTWREVDALHAAQVPGGQNLWGLLDERDDPYDDRWEGYVFGLHRELLTPELNRDIKQLWGTSAIGRAPDRLVTRVLPHAGAWDAFGAALQFWHRISLAAFSNTEAGPYPEYGLVDIAGNYGDLLDAMEALGHPVDRQFFRDLTDAAHRLGDPEPDPDDEHTTRHEIGDGRSFEITISVTGGRPRGRRTGFEQLRDVMTRHRRAWAAEHLDGYLRARWQTDLRGAAESYNRALHAKGKPPTIRQTITASNATIDRWFAGDTGHLLSSIGQKGPATRPTYARVMPDDVYEFGRLVHRNLGLVEEPEVTDWDDKAAVADNRAARDHNTYRSYAAEKCYGYVQMWEALGRPPAMKEVSGGAGAVRWLNEDDLDQGWVMLADAIARAVGAAPREPGPASPPRPVAAGPEPPSTNPVGAAERTHPAPSRVSATDPDPATERRGLLGRLLRGRRR